MKLETFFEKFDQFADAPYAVAKMRELVLEFAVQGKLVPQNAKDESAEKLLSRIRAEKDELINTGQMKRKRSNGAEDDSDCDSTVPSGWVLTTLGEVAQKITDGTHQTPVYVAEGVPFISVKDFSGGKLDFSSTRFISPDEHAQLYKRCDPRRGDILLGRIGTLGKAVLVDTDIEFSLFVSVALIRFSQRFIEPAFFRLLLNSPHTKLEFDRIKIGGATHTNKLNLSDLHIISVPLPPLAEQKRIVAKVDELMALCDRLEAQQQEREAQHALLARASLARFADAPTPANLDFLFHKSYTIPPADLRKSILTLAVQGKLVPQDPNDEPAEELLARLGLKSTAPKSDAEDDSRTVAWARVRFEDIALVAGGVTLGRKLAERKTITLPYLRVANVKRGEIDLTVIKEVAIAEDELDRYALRENDLLMTEGGDWDKVGRAAIWRAEIPVCLHQNHVFRARMRSFELTPFWFELYFNSPIGRSYFESASKQTTNLASINMRQVRSCPVPLPPLDEQRRIVAKVDQLMALVDALETQLAASRTAAEKLLSALISELTTKRVLEKTAPAAAPALVLLPKPAAHKPPNRHFARALLSAEIIHRLHEEKTLGRTKHQKIFHVCEHIAQLSEIQGQYHREAAGPLDNRLIYSNEAELKKQQWYEEFKRDSYGHAYRALPKAGAHRTYLERYWPEKLPVIEKLIELMRDWSTERCEIFSTAYAAWNDLLIQGRKPTHEAILHEILNCWNDTKKRIPADRWLKAIEWMKKEGFEPKGFGKPTLRRS